MWSGMRLSATFDPQFGSSVSELLQSTTRVLIFIVGVVYLTGYLLVRESLRVTVHVYPGSRCIGMSIPSRRLPKPAGGSNYPAHGVGQGGSISAKVVLPQR